MGECLKIGTGNPGLNSNHIRDEYLSGGSRARGRKSPRGERTACAGDRNNPSYRRENFPQDPEKSEKKREKAYPR